MGQEYKIGTKSLKIACKENSFIYFLLQWDPKGTNSLCTFLGHSDLVYNVSWSPHLPNCFASVSGEETE